MLAMSVDSDTHIDIQGMQGWKSLDFYRDFLIFKHFLFYF